MFTDEINLDIIELDRLNQRGLLTVDDCMTILGIVYENTDKTA